MRILTPSAFWFLLLLVPLIWMSVFNFRNAYEFLFQITHSHLKEEILDTFWIKKFLSSLCLFFSMLFLILALAGFARREITIQETLSDVDIIFVLDISNSMLAQDRVGVSRLLEAKRLVSELANRFQRKSYNFGLVAFKGRSETFLPLTTDILFLENLLKSLSPLMIEVRGSDLTGGLKEARQHLNDSSNQKVIILLSDGGNTSKDQAALLQDMNLDGIKLVVLGIGGKEAIGFSDSNGQSVLEKNGGPVLSRQEEDYLKRLADDINGLYLNTFEQGISFSINEVEEYLFSLGLNNKGIQLISIYRWFLILSFLFLLFHLAVVKVKVRGLL